MATETAPQPDHGVVWKLEDNHIVGTFDCTATEGAPCRLVCGVSGWDCTDGESIEIHRDDAGPYHLRYDDALDQDLRHPLVDGGSCGLVDWMNDDPSMMPERFRGDVTIGRTPVWTIWTGDDMDLTTTPRSCRACGCTEERPCLTGCRWVDADLCSCCAARGAS